MPGKIKGYTILQMMLTIALIAILASIVFIAINPAKNFADTRNEQRASDLRSLTNGLQQYTVNHQGKIFPGIDSKLRIIGTSGSGCNMSCTIVAAQGDPTANFAYSANSATAFNSGTYSNTTFNNITQMVELNTNGKTAKTGYYTSPILDAHGSSIWTTLNWLPQDKYNFALPDNKASVDTGAAGVINMSNNQVLFHFNSVNGTTVSDSSGTGNNGTVHNTALVQGNFGQALQFNGTSSYVNIPINASLNPTTNLTLEAWVKWNINPATGSQWAQIIDKNGDSSYQIQHSQTNSSFEFATQTNLSRKWAQSTTIPAQGVWYYIVGTYDGASMKLYVNGNLEKTISQTGTITTNNAEVNIGRRSNFGDRYFDGVIDEVAIYNRTLSAVEIASRYNAGKAELNFQVRACPDAVCAANNFVGPDGTTATYYKAGSLSSLAFEGSLIGRYFQYRTTLNTGSTNFTPRLAAIDIAAQNLNVQVTTSEASCLDLSPMLNDSELVTIPQDPNSGTTAKTNYGVRAVNGTTQLYACNSELGTILMRSFH